MSANSQVFQFGDEAGNVNYLGPIIKAADVEQLLVDKLNQGLVPAINSLINRVQDLSTGNRNLAFIIKTRSFHSTSTSGMPEIHKIKEETSTAAASFRSGLEAGNADVKKSLEAFRVQMETLFESMQKLAPFSKNASDSLGAPFTSSDEIISPGPYVTVNVAGTDFPYFLTNSVWGQVSGCNTQRTIARVVLESMYSIKDLRQYTLTGKGPFMRNQENITAGATARKQIPPQAVEIAKAVVVKVMDRDIRRKHLDVTNAEGYNPYLAEVKKVKKRVRYDITHILNAYRYDYDDDGLKVVKKRIRTRLDDDDDNGSD